MSADNDYWPAKVETMRRIEAELRTENERLTAVAQAAKALASECEDRGYRCEVPEHRLVALESALEAAGYGLTDDEGVESESP